MVVFYRVISPPPEVIHRLSSKAISIKAFSKVPEELSNLQNKGSNDFLSGDDIV